MICENQIKDMDRVISIRNCYRTAKWRVKFQNNSEMCVCGICKGVIQRAYKDDMSNIPTFEKLEE